MNCFCAAGRCALYWSKPTGLLRAKAQSTAHMAVLVLDCSQWLPKEAEETASLVVACRRPGM